MRTKDLQTVFRLINELVHTRTPYVDPMIGEMLQAARQLQPDIDSLLVQRLAALSCDTQSINSIEARRTNRLSLT